MKRHGFTLLELAVVLAIVAVVITLCVVGIRRLREAQNQAQTTNNLKQTVLAAHGFHDAYRKLPSAFAVHPLWDFPFSVHVHLIPFMESNTWFKEFLDKKGKGGTTNFVLPFYLAPGDPTATDGKGIQNYPANLRVFSDKGFNSKYDADMPALAEIEPGSASIPASFARGTSTTILFATKYAKCRDGGSRYAEPPNSKFAAFFGQNATKVRADAAEVTATFQLYPSDADCLTSPLMAQSISSSGISVGLADGSIRFISPSISPRTWNLVLQANEKLEPGDDW
jgi:prepilin-type N-terminal cleavage/methylation domain-containing protein